MTQVNQDLIHDLLTGPTPSKTIETNIGQDMGNQIAMLTNAHDPVTVTLSLGPGDHMTGKVVKAYM